MWNERLAQDKEVVFGKIRIEGTRIYLSIILNLIASGENREQIIDAYPSLSVEDIDAALWFAHNLVKYHEIRKDLQLREILDISKLDEQFDFLMGLDPEYIQWIKFLVNKCGFKFDSSPYDRSVSGSHSIRLYSSVIEDMTHFIPVEIDFERMRITDSGRVNEEQFLHGRGDEDDYKSYAKAYGIDNEDGKLVLDISTVNNEVELLTKMHDLIFITRVLINRFIKNKIIPSFWKS